MHRISLSALLPLNLKSLLSSELASVHCIALSPWACEGRGGETGQGRYGAAYRGANLCPCSGEGLGDCLLLPTIKPFAGVSLGRKAPWSADYHPGVFHCFLPSLPLALTKKDRTNSITAKIQGKQWSLEGILTHSKQCQHLWGVGRWIDTVSSIDRKDPFLMGSHTEKATVLFCCV